MTGNSSHRTQKITLRLFSTFVLFILFPSIVLSGLVISYIGNESREQVERMLLKETTSFRHSVLERLKLVEERLILFADQANREQRISPLTLRSQGIELEYSLFDDDLVPRPGHQVTKQALEAGRTLIVPEAEGGRILMVRAVNSNDLQRGLSTVTINNDLILGAPELRDLRFENCIFDASGRLLIYSNPGLCGGFGNAMDNKHGLITVTQDGTDYFLSYKEVFLAEQYGNDGWVVAVAAPTGDILESSKLFEKRYLGLAAITILSLALASIRLIRQQMSPLITIMQGIESISRRDYDHRVDVQSGDEFEDMAIAFNSMSERVSHQMLTMSSMSEIDQLILSRVRKEDIIRIALERTADIISGGPVFMIMLEKDSSEAKLFYQKTGTNGLENADVTLTEDEIQKSLTTDFYIATPEEDIARSLAAVIPRQGGRHHLILPIRFKQELVALLLVTLDEQMQFNADQETVMLDYGSRIAVALSNAEWEDRLYRQAHFDTLTGLPNRHALRDQLDQLIARAKRDGETFGVLFIDLDNFKLINDALGHSIGDEFLQEVAKSLSHTLRENDFVSRLGGDEFVIVSSSRSNNGMTVSSMSEIASRVQHATTKPHKLRGHDLRSSSSIGIALYPKDGEDAESLLKNADTAMYHAKSEGSGSFHYFSEDLNMQSQTLMQLSIELQTALEQDQFRVHYQPKIDLASRKIIGAEALIRWHHPERGMVPPGMFIEAAESLGLINAIGDWVLSAVCRKLRDWEQAEGGGIRIAVNVSADQIQRKGFVGKIQHLLHNYQISSAMLELEITEGALIADIEGTVATLFELRSMGISISVDDYGTGYSSLAYLKQFPVDTLKIDCSFIRDLANDTADQAIVESTIVLAQRLGLKTVAEGVEDAEQVSILEEYNCDQIQGYFFSRPVPADEFEALLILDRGGCGDSSIQRPSPGEDIISVRT